ncbi:hypothetical protein BDW22DRAFT_1355995 [Trametopsis cervina]|nr:hypothetical protein BDW22DRAFT_1355995 [Trametopsis cervina]
MGWDKQDDGYTTTIALPRTADELSVFARGLSTSGDVSIIQDERLHDTDKVHIDVVAKHMTYLYLDVFAVCILEKKTGHRGVGIFTPTQWSSRAARPRFEFDVTIRLPKVPDSHPLHIPSFETHLPNFSHHVGDLLGHVNFDRLSLYGSNSHIYARSVNATQGVFNTSNAHIRGQFESHGELTLKTSNADIEADVTMYNHNADVPSNVHLTSSNAYINSTVNLPSGYAFTVTTTTSNGRIALDVPSLAADARLMLTAETSNTPAEVRVTNAFEGTFDVRTSGAKAIVRHAPATDPTGRGRRRTHQESGSVSHVKGSVQWLGEHVEAIPSSNSEGSVVVRTRNAPATLYL